MNIKNVSELNKNWLKEYVIRMNADGETEINEEALDNVMEWLSETCGCDFYQFKSDFDMIGTFLSLYNLKRFVDFYNEVDGNLLESYCYLEEDCEIEFLIDKHALFEKIMLIVENMNPYEILEFHKFLIDNIHFE